MKQRIEFLCLASWLVAVGLAPLAHAQSRATIPIQGSLADFTGSPIDGTHTLTFSLFEEESGQGTALFSESQSVSIKNGYFTVYLGSTSSAGLDLSLFRDHHNLWLQVIIDAKDVLSPLYRLGSVPYAGYAAHASDATTLNGLAASAYGLAKDSLGALSGSCSESGYVPQWDSATTKWYCGKISTATGFTGDDARKAMGPVSNDNTYNHVRYTDAEAASAARAACYDDQDPNGTIPAAKISAIPISQVTGNLPASRVELGDYYSSAQVDTKLAAKSDNGHTHDDLYYRKAEVDSAVDAKMDKGAITVPELSGGPTNAIAYSDVSTNVEMGWREYAADAFASSHQVTCNTGTAPRGRMMVMKDNWRDMLCVCMKRGNGYYYWYCLWPGHLQGN